MGKFICKRCREPLKWDQERGWVHLDGERYRKKRDEITGAETEAIDHIARPVKVKEEKGTSTGRLKRSLRKFQRWPY